MTRRIDWKFFVCALILSGCQSSGSYLPWQTSSKDQYSMDALASLEEQLVPAAARPVLAGDTQEPNASNITTVSATKTEPFAAGRINQLIRSGQTAIREAGQGNPAKLQEAQQIFYQVLQAEPTNPSASHGLAIVADLQKDWKTAEHYYKQALQQRPQDPSLLNDLGYSYLLQNRFHDASKFLTQAIQLSPQHERAHINLALLFLKRNDRIGAQNQLASIYSPSEISATLARLEQDLSKTAAGTPAQPVSSTVPQNGLPVNNGFQNGGPLMNTMSPQIPGSQPFYGPPQGVGSQQNFGLQPGAGVPPNPGVMYNSGIPQNQYVPVPYNGLMPDGGHQQYQQQQNTPEKPIHIYPPGVQVDPSQNPVNTPSDQGNGVMPSAAYPGNVQNGNAGNVGPLHNAAYPNNQNGQAVGGVISAPQPQAVDPRQSIPNAAANIYGPQSTIQNGVNQQFYSNGMPVGTISQGAAQPLIHSVAPNTDNRTPMAGLNAGPGTLFPVQPVPATNSMGNAPQTAFPQRQMPQQYPQQRPEPQQQYPPGVMNYPPQNQPGVGSPIATVSSRNIQPTYSVQQQGMSPGATAYPGQFQSGVPANTNGMQAYEQQLQQLNSQYNQTLQQMNGTNRNLMNQNFAR